MKRSNLKLKFETKTTPSDSFSKSVVSETLSNLKLHFQTKTVLSHNFSKFDAFDAQIGYETRAILRYHSKQKLLLLTLSVKVMSLMFMLTMTLETDAFDVQVDCQT